MAEGSRAKAKGKSVLWLTPQPQDQTLDSQLPKASKPNRKRKRTKMIKSKNDFKEKSDTTICPKLRREMISNYSEISQSLAPQVPSISCSMNEEWEQLKLNQQCAQWEEITDDQETLAGMATLKASMMELEANLLLMEVENQRDVELIERENMMIKKLVSLMKQYPGQEMTQSSKSAELFQRIKQTLPMMNK